MSHPSLWGVGYTLPKGYTQALLPQTSMPDDILIQCVPHQYKIHLVFWTFECVTFIHCATENEHVFVFLSMYTVLGVVAAMHCGIIDKLLLKLTNYCHTLHFADFQERENRMNVKGQQDHQTKEWCCFNGRHWHDVQI